MARKKEEKQLVKVDENTLPQPYFSTSDIDGKTLNEVSQFFYNLKESLRTILTDCKFENIDELVENARIIEIYDYDGNSWRLESFRLETDEEFEKRLEKNKKIAQSKKEAAKLEAAKKEKEELELYNKLKQKYEK